MPGWTRLSRGHSYSDRRVLGQDPVEFDFTIALVVELQIEVEGARFLLRLKDFHKEIGYRRTQTVPEANLKRTENSGGRIWRIDISLMGTAEAWRTRKKT